MRQISAQVDLWRESVCDIAGKKRARGKCPWVQEGGCLLRLGGCAPALANFGGVGQMFFIQP